MTSSNRTYKAFVSSTFKDLKEHRAHVIRSLGRGGVSVDPMENWTADSDEPKKFSQDRLAGCDLCVLLVAFRRGFVPEGETHSITQMEYESALKQGVDVLVFQLDDNAKWWAKYDEREKDPALEVWRSSLGKKHGVEFFTDDPLSIDVSGALTRWLAKKKTVQPEAGKIERIDWPEDKSPYPGLLWFDEEYVPLFFGRDREVEAVLAKMREPQGRFLVISGASGSGKSSLVAAGLWQAVIKRGQLPGSERWRWKRMIPGPGKLGPFVKLAIGLQESFPQLTVGVDELSALLEKDAMAEGRCITTHPTDGRELVLVIDQLEELFTQGYSADTIQAFLAALVTVSGYPQHRLRVVTAIRSDFFGRLAESESVLKQINDGFQYLVPPISPTAWPDVIKKPADATGFTFEPGLVDAILNEVGLGKESGNLPLLAYALSQLFEQRQNNTFTLAAYQAMGGVAGAIASTADQIMEKLGDGASTSFDRVFAELVNLERDRPPTRKRVPVAVFQHDASATQLIQTLAKWNCRILVASEQAQEPTVEVAHEKLFTAWPRLKKWIDDSGTDLRLIDYAEEAATRWHETGRHLQELWRYERAQPILNALTRFKKPPSPSLEALLRPQQMLIERLNDQTLSHQDRLLIGQKLAEFGDTRPGVGLRSDGLPEIVWIDIPEGRIELKEVDHVFEVRPFRMAKYLVTNAQFEAFDKAKDGYQNEEWWKGMRRYSWKSWGTSWQEANAPREHVSWHEAVAFCRWLSHRTRSTIRLPAEWEWQQAATGGDSTRDYPWPGERDAARCNCDESRLERTTAVGMYPSGATQQGVLDMEGNLCEWCLNTCDRPEPPESLRIDNSDTSRVVRGGSWDYKPEDLSNISERYMYSAEPVVPVNTIGFRLAQDIP